MVPFAAFGLELVLLKAARDENAATESESEPVESSDAEFEPDDEPTS